LNSQSRARTRSSYTSDTTAAGFGGGGESDEDDEEEVVFDFDDFDDFFDFVDSSDILSPFFFPSPVSSSVCALCCVWVVLRRWLWLGLARLGDGRWVRGGWKRK